MPHYLAPPFSIDVIQNAIFVDTNVWVSAFTESEPDHLRAFDFIESTSKLILIPVGVIVETWGMLLKNKSVEKDKRKERCIAFLAWLTDPGHNVRLIPELNHSANYIFDPITSLGVDCVDAMLAYLAHHVNEHCDIDIAIASSDMRDFPKLRRDRNLRYKIYDISQDDPY